MEGGFGHLFNNLTRAFYPALALTCRVKPELLPILESWARQEGYQPEELLDAIVESSLLSRRYAEDVLERWAQLTDREKEVTALFSLGMNRREIAIALTVEPNTVKAHLRNSMQTMSCATLEELRATLGFIDLKKWVETYLAARKRKASPPGAPARRSPLNPPG